MRGWNGDDVVVGESDETTHARDDLGVVCIGNARDCGGDDGGGGALGNVIVQAVALSERTRETHWLSAVDVDKIVDGLYEDDVDDRCPTWSD